MVIEHAERFGLAQLHQLRGRVGRGATQSFCLLLHEDWVNDTARRRLTLLRDTEDGFLIADEDFRLRGGGDALGTRQAGLPGYRLAECRGTRRPAAHGQPRRRRAAVARPDAEHPARRSGPGAAAAVRAARRHENPRRRLGRVVNQIGQGRDIRIRMNAERPLQYDRHAGSINDGPSLHCRFAFLAHFGRFCRDNQLAPETSPDHAGMHRTIGRSPRCDQ